MGEFAKFKTKPYNKKDDEGNNQNTEIYDWKCNQQNEGFKRNFIEVFCQNQGDDSEK
jgi:hypothetical protein